MIKRFDGSSWVDCATTKRWDGGSWVECGFVRRFDGSSWVDLLFPRVAKYHTMTYTGTPTTYSIASDSKSMNFSVRGVAGNTNNVWFRMDGNWGTTISVTFYLNSSLTPYETNGHIMTLVNEGVRASTIQGESDAYWTHNANRTFTINYTHTSPINTIYLLFGSYDTFYNTGTISNLKINNIDYNFSL